MKDISRRNRIETIVRECGVLRVATHNSDYDEFGNLIVSKVMERHAGDFEIAEEFVKKYNPDGLPADKYAEAYVNNKLPWQNQ